MNPSTLKAFSEILQRKLPTNIEASWNAVPESLVGATTCTLTFKTVDTQKVILRVTYTEIFAPLEEDADYFIPLIKTLYDRR
jgi:thioredoxin reductase